MNDLKPNKGTQLNPPLRIFNFSDANVTPSSQTTRFGRPQLQRLVRHDRVARYFTRRGLSFGSPLD